MTAHAPLDTSGWDWVAPEREGAPSGGLVFDPLGSLTFARGLSADRAVTVAEMFEAFGLDPATVFDADPARAERIGPSASSGAVEAVRVAVSGTWVVAIEPANIRRVLEGIELDHRGREVFGMSFVTIQGRVEWGYARDGVHRASGDPQRLPTDGPDAERFAAALRAAGLPRHAVQPPVTPDWNERSERERAEQLRRSNREWAQNIVGTLTVLGREIGFSLPAELYRSPLPTTAQRRHHAGEP